MVTARLMFAAYPVNGVFETLGGFLTYLVIMRDFGFPIVELFGLATKVGYVPNTGDTYDLNAPYNGMTSTGFVDYCNACWAGTGNCDYDKFDTDDNTFRVPDWIYNKDRIRDLRLFYLKCDVVNGNPNIYVDRRFSECRVLQVDQLAETPLCFTTSALKYAQTGFFFSIVIGQLSNAFNTKTKLHSFMYSGLGNFSLLFGFTTEFALTLIVGFANPINVAFNTRPVIFLHYGIPSIPFSIFSLLYEEWRKFMVRNLKSSDKRKPNWFVRNTYW